MELFTVEVIIRVVFVLGGMMAARFYARKRVSHKLAILQALAVLLLGAVLITALTQLGLPELLVDGVDLIISFIAGWAYGRHRLDSSIFRSD